MHTKEEKLKALGDVLDTLDILRVKCPWDAKQTNESLRANTIEETYELASAILDNDNANICKELGDVLLHIFFYAKIGQENEAFDIADVANALNAKLIFRHPHVFGEEKALDAHQVEQNWEQIKLKEKGGNRTVLEGVPAALPALIKAYRIQEKAANAGFDWEQPRQVWDKVKEELEETEAEIRACEDSDSIKANKERIEEEFGDLMFAVVNAARLYKVNPENALEKCNRKFMRRFAHVEKRASETGKKLNDMTLQEMDQYWDEAKALEKE